MSHANPRSLVFIAFATTAGALIGSIFASVDIGALAGAAISTGIVTVA